MKVKYRNKNRLQRLIFLIGLPATGKSTLTKYLNQRNRYEVVCVDKFIRDLSTKHNITVTETLEKFKDQIREEISRQASVVRVLNASVIVDMSNLISDERIRLMKEINKSYRGPNCDKIAIFFNAPLEGILERNRMRYLSNQDHSEISLRSMFNSIEGPKEKEFDYIMVVNDHEMVDYQKDYLHTLQNT